MKSLRELFKIGVGPSSSHTMAPEKASKLFFDEYPNAVSFKVILFGSLAKTGGGHGTDTVLKKTLIKPTEVIFDTQTIELPHENTLDFYAYDDLGCEVGYWRVLSVGGGAIEIVGKKSYEPDDVYPQSSFSEIVNYCNDNNIRIPDYVEKIEGAAIWDYLMDMWTQMKATIASGLKAKGVIPGGLEIQRKANFLFRQRHIDESPETRENRIVCSYAFACSEENACGGTVVTAPTCGSCGVLPAVLKYMQDRSGFDDRLIVRALATAGIVGNIVKENASISGAECGCQAEIGTASSMASAALAELFDMQLEQIEYAAEVAMEHNLGLTCDPVRGLVQIPCIERNAVAAMRALSALSLANFLTYTRKISFDMVVETMYQTGKDMSKIYRETSEGGLAKLYK
ncbi:MAG: L-serine ammonia-lyase, iron-sulfur-dependent, subunit alpha [Clostridia bacterium]